MDSKGNSNESILGFMQKLELLIRKMGEIEKDFIDLQKNGRASIQNTVQINEGSGEIIGLKE